MIKFTNQDNIVTVLRLRGFDRYTGENLRTIVDPCYFLLNHYISNNSTEWTWNTYNLTLPAVRSDKGKLRTEHNLDLLIKSKVIIIITEGEFLYHIKDRVSTFKSNRTWSLLKDIFDAFDAAEELPKKKIILLTQDRADTVELFKNRVFSERVIPHKPYDFEYIRLDEGDFPSPLSNLRHYFIKDWLNSNDIQIKNTGIDFGYWGTSKRYKVDMDSEEVDVPIYEWYSKDTDEISKNPNEEKNYKKVRFTVKQLKRIESNDFRHEILKASRKDKELNTRMIGYFDNFKYDIPFNKDFTQLIQPISECNATLCFNWPGEHLWTTARYPEALACGVVPLVWQDYDSQYKLVADDWQRCYNYDDFRNKLIQLRDEEFRKEMYSKILEVYNEKTQTIDQYREFFNSKLTEFLK